MRGLLDGYLHHSVSGSADFVAGGLVHIQDQARPFVLDAYAYSLDQAVGRNRRRAHFLPGSWQVNHLTGRVGKNKGPAGKGIFRFNA
jgi:hypothetical protein